MAHSSRTESSDQLGDLLRGKLVDLGVLSPDADLTSDAQQALARLLHSVHTEDEVLGREPRSWGAAYQLAGRLIAGRSIIGRNARWVAELLERPVDEIATARRRGPQKVALNSLLPASPMPSIRVGISGATSVGKTTLAHQIQRKLTVDSNFGQITVYDNIAREVIHQGATHDQNTVFDDYALYFRRHLEYINRATTAGCTIYVRTFFDTLAYATVNGNLNYVWTEMLLEVGYLIAKIFDLYFYLPIESNVPLVDDGIRSVDPDYRLEVDRMIQRILGSFIPNYVEIKGTLEQRTETAVSAISALKEGNRK